MSIVTVLSYLAVYFLGITSTVIFLIVFVQKYDRETDRRQKASSEAAGRLKEHLDSMPTPNGTILTHKD